MAEAKTIGLPSAILVLLRDAPEGPEVLLVRRAENQRAFPGYWSFPGGALDAADKSELQDHPDDADDTPFRRAALRELFEETGLLPGYTGPAEALGAAQQALLSQSSSWRETCLQLGYSPPLAAVQAIGLRVTPPIAPRRFATQYFLLRLKADELREAAIALSPELAEAAWIRPGEMLRRWEFGQDLISPPVLEVLRVLAAAGEPDLGALRALANDIDSLPMPIEVHPGIEMVPVLTPTLAPATHTNSYLVGRERFVIIDPATPYPEEQAVLRRFLQRRLDLGHRPLAVLLTHHHRDHIGAACFMRDWLGVPVQAHAATAALLDFDVDATIEDGQEWQLGSDPATGAPWSLQALFTPGHAPGHLCFVDSRQGASVVGDMLAGMGTILIKRPKGDMGQYLASLQRLADAAGAYPHPVRGFPAHGPLIPDLRARSLEYIAHRQMRDEKILAALGQGPLADDALLAAVYADIDPRALPIARWSLEAHLHRLEHIGRVQHCESGWQAVP